MMTVKRMDIEPSDSVIRDCFAKGDIVRSKELLAFINLLRDVDPPFVLCLDAPWGSGKTFFVKEVIFCLKCLNAACEECSLNDLGSFRSAQWTTQIGEADFLPVYFNAWDNDMLESPLSAIAASLAADFDVDVSDGAITKKAAGVIDSALGLLGLSPNFRGLLEPIAGVKFVQQYRERRELEFKVDDLIHEVLRERSDKLVLFIDELDRCRPDFAVRLLGDIKNLLCRDDVVIVISTDLSQLAFSLDGQYGTRFDSGKYLERFYDRRIELRMLNPEITLGRAYSLEFRSKRFDLIVKELVSALQLTWRDVNRLPNFEEAKAIAMRTERYNDVPGFLAAFAEIGVLPALVLAKYASEKLWMQVRRGDFGGVYDFAKASSSFDWLLVQAFAHTRNDPDAPGDEVKAQFVTDICGLLFLPQDYKNDSWREASERVTSDFVYLVDVSAMRAILELDDLVLAGR